MGLNPDPAGLPPTAGQSPTPASNHATGLRAWFWRNRTSTRLAFILRTVTLLLGSAFALLWARLLVRALGRETYGLFLTFLAVAQLGGLGDLGISGAVGIRMLQYLARGEEEPGRRFLANARGVFLGMALAFLAGFMVLAPWLPGWLKLLPTPESGSLPLLFVFGGVAAALLILNGYFQNLNAIHGNTAWPLLPAFLLTQLGFFGQWLLAIRGAPLWSQYALTLLMSLAAAVFGILILRISHPWLGSLWPVACDWAETRALVSTSFWVYLCVLGNLVYVSTDQILVNAGFGSAQVPAYRFNYKLCEFAVTVLAVASYVSMPAIVRRLLSPDPAEKAQGRSGFDRLQKLQAFAGCAFAMGYLCVNDGFITLWQGSEFHMPLALQVMFALNLAITISGDAALQVRGRLDIAGIRLAGITIGCAGLLNLGLSFLAMRAGFLVGIAGATVVAQSVVVLVMSRSTCRLLGLSWPAWLARSWLVPLLVVGLFAAVRHLFPAVGMLNIFCLGASCLALMAFLAWALGIRWPLLADEARRLLASIR